MTNPLNHDQDTEEGRYCPKCRADWRAQEIPREYVEKGHYGHVAPCQRKKTDYFETGTLYDETVPCTCPPRYYSRLVGVEYPYDHPAHYDGISEWLCPDCGARWSRWTGNELEEGQVARRGVKAV